jgi:hypothetical protein
MSKIAGAYSVNYGGAHVGQIADGVTFEYFVNKQLITGDNEGLTPQDAVFQGHECFMEFTLMEYDDAAALDVFWPYNPDITTFGHQGAVGRLDVDSSLTKILLLDHVAAGSESAGAGTPAATQPDTLTADRAILAEGFPVRMFFGPTRYRSIPVRLRLYPNAAGEFFSTTQS